MITTIHEYQELASRTCPDLGSADLNFLHMKLGVITEAGELLDVIKKNIAYGKEIDIINVGEEIADMCWYIVNNFTQRGESLTNMTYGWSPVNSLIDVVEYVETLILLWADREETRIYNKIGF